MNTITHNELAHTNATNGHAHTATAVAEGPVPVEDIDNLIIRIAGSGDEESIDELAQRAGSTRPAAGALMLAAVDGKVLAAASMSRREGLSEPTPSGLAARAVVEYTLANLERRGTLPRRAA
jgi:hypothetical protein